MVWLDVKTTGRAGRRRRFFIKMASKEAWHRDINHAACELCSEKFTVTKRRHHCRACGIVACSVCTSGRLRMYGTDCQARVCDSCVSAISTNQVLDHLDSVPLPPGCEIDKKSFCFVDEGNDKDIERKWPRDSTYSFDSLVDAQVDTVHVASHSAPATPRSCVRSTSCVRSGSCIPRSAS